MKKKQIAITLGFMCFALTVAISIQLKTVKNSNLAVSQSLMQDSLRDEVLKWKEKYDNTYEALIGSDKELEEIRKRATQDDKTSQAKQKEIEENNKRLGMNDVTGPGFEIILTDNVSGLNSEGKELWDLSEAVVHREDILEVINALNNAGAEAISVNGHRVVQTTSLTCEGNIIKINGQRISSPFTIKAIGSPGLLSGGLTMPGGYLYWLENRTIKVEYKQSENVMVEKYNGVMNYKYIRSKK